MLVLCLCFSLYRFTVFLVPVSISHMDMGRGEVKRAKHKIHSHGSPTASQQFSRGLRLWQKVHGIALVSCYYVYIYIYKAEIAKPKNNVKDIE